MGLRNLRVKTGRYLRLDSVEKGLFREAFYLHIWVWLLLRFIPFKKIPDLFADSGVSANENDINILEQIKQAVRRASGVIPFKNECLVSSLAARLMLNSRRIKSKISLGVAKIDGGKFIAHAWIISDSFEIVEQMGDYETLYFF